MEGALMLPPAAIEVSVVLPEGDFLLTAKVSNSVRIERGDVEQNGMEVIGLAVARLIDGIDWAVTDALQQHHYRLYPETAVAMLHNAAGVSDADS